ncbi:hypothetical protein P8452_49973 [Trifolium repens]|nr:hypothetical protein P8452_49973 [Trifolium repens]
MFGRASQLKGSSWPPIFLSKLWKLTALCRLLPVTQRPTASTLKTIFLSSQPSPSGSKLSPSLNSRT